MNCDDVKQKQCSIFNIIRKVNAKFCLHLSCLALAEEYRRRDNIVRSIIATFMKEVFSKGGVCTTVANFSGFEKFMDSQFPEHTRLEDRVRYEDIQLTLSDGDQPLHSLAHLAEIKYFSLYNHSSVQL